MQDTSGIPDFQQVFGGSYLKLEPCRLTPSSAIADTGYMPTPLKLAVIAVALCAFAAPAQANPDELEQLVRR